ncbi:hypothetical protein [Amycolatopsis sp. CA-126428]|uniref:hypothetical protein n=1 Tax=Amycolatopsis sp. CA-126428 TaxID=2073158 RepID=UPI000CD1E34E|nr:hypothetical protein [Amycolatopsis sp. CA-126428]
MTDLYGLAVHCLAENALRRNAQEHQADHLTWHDFADEAREDLATMAGEGLLNVYLARQIHDRQAAS